MRPRYHFSPARNWLSDPNGLVHDGTWWHLFYQYNPMGTDWGSMSWGHAVSIDLVHWEELPPALLADNARAVYSGSAVIDHANSAGLGHGAMVALYTAAAMRAPHQAQALAWSTDNGTTWAEHPDNPLLDLGMADFRDPYVFRHDETDSWIMVVVKAAEQVAQIYRSPDLQRWTLASEIGAGSAPGRVWECPTLVELPVVGTRTSRWLFKVDALHDAPGSGALCRTGSFDGIRFVPDGDWQAVDQGRDFYAAIAWNGPRDSSGRPAWIGWMGNHAYQHDLPAQEWRGVMSLPRRMSLVPGPDGLRLAQAIEPPVGRLFAAAAPLSATGTVESACCITLSSGFTGSLVLEDGAASRFAIRASGDRWVIERQDTSLPFLDDEAVLDRHEDDNLAVWIDSETIEVLTGCGTGCASFQHRPAAARLSVETDQPDAVSVAHLA